MNLDTNKNMDEVIATITARVTKNLTEALQESMALLGTRMTAQLNMALSERASEFRDTVALRVYASIKDEYPHIHSLISKELVSSKDAQAILDVSKTTLYKLAKQYPEIKEGKSFNYKALLELNKLKEKGL